MSPGYKDLLYLQTLTREPQGAHPVGNAVCSMTYNLSLEPLRISLMGQKRPANGTVLWHIPFLETERIAAVTV